MEWNEADLPVGSRRSGSVEAGVKQSSSARGAGWASAARTSKEEQTETFDFPIMTKQKGHVAAACCNTVDELQWAESP